MARVRSGCGEGVVGVWLGCSWAVVMARARVGAVIRVRVRVRGLRTLGVVELVTQRATPRGELWLGLGFVLGLGLGLGLGSGLC